jgi:hypothetical protein
MKSRIRTSKPIIVSVVIIFLILILAFPAEWILSPAQITGPIDDCGLIEPSRKDVDKILSIGKELFNTDKWTKSYTVEPYKITITRHNDAEAGVAYTEYLIYTCGYGQQELNDYFNNEGFKNVFNGYESYNQAAFCEIPNDLALYKFDLVDEGKEYTAHYWVEQTDDTHVLVMMLVFPRESTAQFDEYSKKLFPELTSCQ